MDRRPLTTDAVLEFGPDNTLVGVLTTLPGASNAAPPVVFVNPGLVHRIGPNRLYVRLARAIAAQGVAAFRIDLPGIGDSGQPAELGAEPRQSHPAAVGLAIDLLASHGFGDRCIVTGLCSGADLAVQAALTDPRVVGIVLIDPNYLLPTPRARRRALWARLGRLKDPRVWLRRGLRAAGLAPEPVVKETPKPTATERAQLRARIAEVLGSLIDRSVQMCLVVTGDRWEDFNYPDQLADAFPELDLTGRARVEIIRDADHTFTRESAVISLRRRLLEWLEETYPRR